MDSEGVPLHAFGRVAACVEIKILRRVLLNHRADLNAIDATPARWRGDVGSPPLDGASADALVDFHTGRGPPLLPSFIMPSSHRPHHGPVCGAVGVRRGVSKGRREAASAR